ncbi:AzlC family ABC transporter permease [bacterium]|nr:AzlC family ABC transporter permease [bacterium]
MQEALSPTAEAAQARPTHTVPWEFLPLAVAFLTISFAFGAAARDVGMPWWGSLLMSTFVYAGTSQVVALGLMAAHQPIWLIVTVTFLVNARFLLLATVLSARVSAWKPWARWLFATQLTDESFALLATRTGAFQSPRLALWIQVGAHIAWILGTGVGFAVGASSAQLRGFGLDFALIAMMLAVMVILIRDTKTLAVALCAGAVSILAVQWGISWLSVLLAAVVGPAVGVFWERRCHAPKS